MTIEQMDLEPDVEAKARELERVAPDVIFTSGRRSVGDQARAMAQNVLRVRGYVGLTYTHSPVAIELQKWINAHPKARDLGQIAAGFAAVMHRFAPSELAHLSRHLSGRAFDVQPHSCTAAQIEALQPELFLQHEAGLERWHCQW